jgi:hypothetical protein
MSEGNGEAIIIVGKKGLKKFRYDENTPAVEIDVIHVGNQWATIDAPFRDESGKVPIEKYEVHMAAAVKFIRELLQIPETENVSSASAMHFLKLLQDEAEALKPFFAPKSAEERSSPTNLDVRYST